MDIHEKTPIEEGKFPITVEVTPKKKIKVGVLTNASNNEFGWKVETDNADDLWKIRFELLDKDDNVIYSPVCHYYSTKIDFGKELYIHDITPDEFGINSYKVTIYGLSKKTLTDYRKESAGIACYPPTDSLLDFKHDSKSSDSKDVKKGFEKGTELKEPIKNSNGGRVAWDMQSYSFMKEAEAPDTVNRVLWRQERLNNYNGLFMVTDKHNEKNGRIYQIRSYDLATMTLVESDSGWIVIDPLGGEENAAEGLRQFRSISEKPIVAILVTHSHVDHYKGIGAILNEGEPGHLTLMSEVPFSEDGQEGTVNMDNIKDKNIIFIAPNGFYEEALSENLYLGNAMQRRAMYMYGSYLPRDERGHVGSGLGKSVGNSNGNLYRPSLELKMDEGMKTKTLHIDGLEVIFQDAPGTEAPAEFHIYFPEYGTLCPGENVSHTMHNLLTSRGAKVRDPKAFAAAIDYAIEQWGKDIKVIIGTHHWPTWDGKCLEMLEKQRDMYRFFNDQVIRMANHGMNMEEIAEEFRLPENLDKEFYNRGYYGAINHNVKAVLQRYLGWWDGNPANYFKYPEEEAARRYVAWMGGEDKVVRKARESYRKKDFRWVAEVMKHVVFSNPENMEARLLQADAFEQLAYTFESGTWRNIFLSGAAELRGNCPIGPQIPSGKEGQKAFVASKADELTTMPPDYIFDYFCTLLKGYEAGKENFSFYVFFKDSTTKWLLQLKNGVLHFKLTDEEKESYHFENVEEFVDDYSKIMNDIIDKIEPPGKELSDKYPDLVRLYKYFDTFDLCWNIVFPSSYPVIANFAGTDYKSAPASIKT